MFDAMEIESVPGTVVEAAQPVAAPPPRGERWIRVVDVAVAGLGVLALAPLFALIAALVWMQDGGSPVFAHRRIGRNGRRFACFKFRTMVRDAESRLRAVLAADPEARAEWARDHKLRSDPRITGLGVFLRKYSLDELPQLLNVLAGEMSLVGPRPIVEAEIAKYGRRFKDYCTVKPGLTGLWQVSGRNDVSYRRRVAIDVVYARQKCLGLDLHIMVRTLPAVLARRGSY